MYKKYKNQIYLHKLEKFVYCPEVMCLIPHPVSVWHSV